MVLRGWREATIAPTTEKVSTMAEVRTKELAAPTLPYGSSRAVDLTIRANATPPTRSATESAHSDQASHEAARVLIPPIPRSCSVVPSVTAALYSSTVSQALRSQAVSELPRMPKRRSSRRRESLHRATPIGPGPPARGCPYRRVLCIRTADVCGSVLRF